MNKEMFSKNAMLCDEIGSFVNVIDNVIYVAPQFITDKPDLENINVLHRIDLTQALNNEEINQYVERVKETLRFRFTNKKISELISKL